MTRRTLTILIALFDAFVCSIVAFGAIASKSDHATLGLDYAAGALAVLVFVLTGGVALALTYFGKAPRLALACALAFPTLLAVLFIAAVIAFSR